MGRFFLVTAKDSMNEMNGGFDGPGIAAAGYYVHDAYK
jgi:hypothetical protein